MFSRLLTIACLAQLAVAKVQFIYSTLYDQYDLQGVAEIPLEACIIGGCSVYVSTTASSVEATRNLFVYSKDAKTNESLYQYATQLDPATSAKKGLHLANTVYSIMNYNGNNVQIGPIVVWVVGGQAPYHNDPAVEVYDAATMNRPAFAKGFTTIMSADPYNLFVQSTGGNNLQAYMRATGYDTNFQRESPDKCQIIYDHNSNSPIRLHINNPIITIAIESTFSTQICTALNQYNGESLDYAGMATSQGYVGCANNLFQTFRSSGYTSSVFALQSANMVNRQIEMNYLVATKQTDKLQFTTVYQGGSNQFEATGTGNQAVVTRTENAYKINAVFTNQYASSYWFGYSPKSGAVVTPTAEGICANYVPSSSTVAATTTTVAPTTSSSNGPMAILLSAAVLLLTRIF